jgi:hypothetical protein
VAVEVGVEVGVDVGVGRGSHETTTCPAGWMTFRIPLVQVTVTLSPTARFSDCWEATTEPRARRDIRIATTAKETNFILFLF